jgi:hypothetical protein
MAQRGTTPDARSAYPRERKSIATVLAEFQEAVGKSPSLADVNVAARIAKEDLTSLRHDHAQGAKTLDQRPPHMEGVGRSALA